jgi:hypothetical protein
VNSTFRCHVQEYTTGIRSRMYQHLASKSQVSNLGFRIKCTCPIHVPQGAGRGGMLFRSGEPWAGVCSVVGELWCVRSCFEFSLGSRWDEKFLVKVMRGISRSERVLEG